MRYIVGADIEIEDSVTLKSLDIESASNISAMDTLFLISNGASLGYRENYAAIKTVIQNGCNVFLIVVGELTNDAKQISMLTVSLGCYNVYTVDEEEEIDKDFMETAESRECTIDEVEAYIGADVAAYPEMSNILVGMGKLIQSADLTALAGYLNSNAEKISAMNELVKYMQETIDELGCSGAGNEQEIERVKKYAEEREQKIKEQLDKATETIRQNMMELEITKKSLDEKDKRIEVLEDEKRTLEKSISDETGDIHEGTSIMKYTTLNVDMLITQKSQTGRTPKVKEIIYFKEVRPCKYINSLVVNMQSILESKYTVKLLIYDNSSDFDCIYKPLPMVDGKYFVNNRDRLMEKSNRMVITEPNRVIIDEILMETDVVIIYDRMKNAHDIVSGKKVHKFWVVNGFNDIDRLLKSDEYRDKISKTDIISNKGSYAYGLCINDYRDYKIMTSSGKKSVYMNLINVGEDDNKKRDTRKLISIILTKAKLADVL